jgi:hypothetical protein
MLNNLLVTLATIAWILAWMWGGTYFFGGGPIAFILCGFVAFVGGTFIEVYDTYRREKNRDTVIRMRNKLRN